MSDDSTEGMLRSHLALAVQILEAIAEETDVDLDSTNLTITVDGQTAGIPVGTMVAKWKEITA